MKAEFSPAGVGDSPKTGWGAAKTAEALFRLPAALPPLFAGDAKTADAMTDGPSEIFLGTLR